MSFSVLDSPAPNLQVGRQPTIQDVANALGLHKSTVSVALSGKGTLSPKTRDRIVSVATAMGYVPNPIAQRLANGYQNPAVYAFEATTSSRMDLDKLMLIQQALGNRGYEVPYYTSSDSPALQAAQIRMLCSHRPKAIILASQSVDHSVYQELMLFQQKSGLLVCYDQEIPIKCDQVIFDWEQNGYSAAKYLHDFGHQKLALCVASNIDWSRGNDNTREKKYVDGFAKAIFDHGISVNGDWIHRSSEAEKGGVELAAAYLRSDNRPTAIVISNDLAALSFMVTITREGVRVPQDLSIIGLENRTLGRYCPVPLTSFSHPTSEIADAVVELLTDNFDNPRATFKNVKVDGKLVERESVASPRF
jgi:LacI family transcriptional regulator